VYLSLNQGTTEVLERVGGAAYLDTLQSRANMFRGLLSSQQLDGLVGPIDLGGSGTLTRGYEAGNILAVRYEAATLPSDEQLDADLARFLDLYTVLVSSQDALAEDADPAAVEAAIEAGMEAAKERWHRRSERNPRLANDAKKFHGSTCMVCGFNFEDRYGEQGAGYIEAHHLTPFSELQGQPKKLDPNTDFIVVCPNCHRMLHRKSPPVPPDELKELVAVHRSQ
jgi:5-methylcytosine-specific restriction protein A